MAILDSLMVFSENQHLTNTTVGALKTILADNYIDLGADSKDYWGDGKTTRPGWWNPDALSIVFKFGSSIPVTAIEANAWLSMNLYGTSSPGYVTAAPNFSETYHYLVGGQARKDWAITYPHSIIFQATIPRIFHRYLFITYTMIQYYAYVDTWLGFGTQALSSIKNPVYPGSIA